MQYNHVRTTASSQVRLVAYSRERKEYLYYDCVGSTQDRTWAWSGTVRQARNMVRTYPAAERFCIYEDGDELFGSALDV